MLLALIAFVGHEFRMSLFFFVAGFFARMVVHRKGLQGFCADRLKRIGIPLVVGSVTLVPAVDSLWTWGMTPNLAWPPMPSPTSPSLSYLWFLYYLLLLYVILLLARTAFLALDRRGIARRAADGFANLLVSHRWLAPLVLGIPAAIALSHFEGRTVFEGIPTPNRSLDPELVPFVAYAVALGFGWLMHRNPQLLSVLRDRWKNYLGAALLANAICVLIITYDVSMDASLFPAERITFALIYRFAAWCWIFCAVGLALQFLFRANPVQRYLADASYWVYLAHYPIVLLLQILLGTMPWHWSIKFPLILAVTTAISLLTYHHLIRFTFVGLVLNGRRMTRAQTVTRPEV
jgi:peptidoglycan/LPS O-acetylase OafA/YrhL